MKLCPHKKNPFHCEECDAECAASDLNQRPEQPSPGGLGASTWLEELTEILRTQAKEIADAGHNGWGNTMTLAADEVTKLRAQIESSSNDPS